MKKTEVEYETTGEVDYETPKRVKKSAERENTCDPGYCWCHRRVRGCNGNPTLVRHLEGKFYQFVCPNGRDRTSVDKRVFEAALKAGLIRQEE